MGTLYERSGRDEEAVDRYTLAATHDPNHAEAHLRLADTLRWTDRLEASLTPYRRVLELEPDWREARFGEAMALVRLARYPEALQRLRAAMELHPEETAFPLAVARLLAASPDPQVRDGREALALARALEQEHKTTAVAETMAMALAEPGRFAEAVEWQRVAMSGAARRGRSRPRSGWPPTWCSTASAGPAARPGGTTTRSTGPARPWSRDCWARLPRSELTLASLAGPCVAPGRRALAGCRAPVGKASRHVGHG